MFPTVAEMLGEVCSCRGEPSLRQLGLKLVSLIYFMYCGQSRNFLNKPRIPIPTVILTKFQIHGMYNVLWACTYMNA